MQNAAAVLGLIINLSKRFINTFLHHTFLVRSSPAMIRFENFL
jgi:hypothetical protein